MTNTLTVHRRIRRLSLFLVPLAWAGCRPSEAIFERDVALTWATAYCDQLFSCKCADTAGFESLEACTVTLAAEVTGQQIDALEHGLVYDADCVSDALDGLRELGCSTDPSDAVACNACFAYRGTVAEDEPCKRVGSFSDCAQGLLCVARVDFDEQPIDVCSPACVRKALGDACAYDGPNFQILHDCDEGLVCDALGSGRCRALPGPASACEAGILCAPDAWCDTSNDPPICAALKQQSEACELDVECESQWCRGYGRCDEPLVQGTPCVPEHDRCALGLTCAPEYPRCTPTDAIQCMAAPTGP
ncbi:MAG: hypothetical protein IAG13_36190 [Deltaproteobacteria bacterium]|nr:hypothetical protein [Nannocystaceae bacterium]